MLKEITRQVNRSDRLLMALVIITVNMDGFEYKSQ